MLIERTCYFAKPGRGPDVLAQRRHASAVRTAIGLPAGTIRVRRDGDGPDVTWECAFPTQAAHASDLQARADSPEFATVRATMRTLLARFERHVEALDDVSPLSNGIVDRPLDGSAMSARELSFRSGGHGLKAYLQLPPGDGAFACMMLAHGSGIDQGTLDVSRPGTASLLAGMNVASFLVHRHGYGNSEGPGWRSEVTAPHGTEEYDAQLSARLDRESDDVLAALDVLASLPEIRADHIGMMGSSFGGVNTLLAVAKTDRFRCAVEFAGAAMNWDRTPGLRRLMTDAALRLTTPIFFLQAANDYSVRPTRELAAALAGTGKIFEAQVYPAFGITPQEGHVFERDGARIWGKDVQRFLERYL
jgi:carboxymethylenebutenolidase